VSNIPSWSNLLPSPSAVEKMGPEELKMTGAAIDEYSFTLGCGIAAIGNLLACTASNSETGLDMKTAADIGWLIESLGALSAQLSNASTGIQDRRRAALKKE
jgi:hypothetical protein